MRIRTSLLLLCGLLLSVSARGEEQVLSYQVFVHNTDVHAFPVPGQPDRSVGIAAFRGISLFGDGRIAGHQYSGHFDFKDGGGQFNGYALWVFEDGSKIETVYVGEATAAEGGGISFTGKHTQVTGSGLYEGVTGEGSFTGRRIDLLEEGGDTYQSGTLTLTQEGGQ